MRIAITGGAGFLGLHLCKKLADKYDEVLVMDEDESIRPESSEPEARLIESSVITFEIVIKKF